MLQAEEATEKKSSEEQRVEEGGGGFYWWLWDVFLGSSPEVKMSESCCGKSINLCSSSVLHSFSTVLFLVEFFVTRGRPLMV